MKNRKLIAGLGIFILSLSILCAAHEDAGTTGFNFLRVNFTPRAAGMANAFTGQADDYQAVFFNPAGLPQLTSRTVTTSYINYFEGFQGGSVVYASPAGENFAFGTFIKYLGSQSITRTIVDEQGEYLGTAGTFGANDIVVGFAGGYYIHEYLNIGGSIRFIHESIDEYSASAAVIDVSLLHQTTNENLQVGVALRNFGTQLTYYTENEYEEDIPLQITVGFHYRIHEKWNGNLDIYKPFENDFSGMIGLEYQAHEVLTLRSGFNSRADDWRMGGDYDFFSGLSAGFGVVHRQYELNYGISSFGDLGIVNQVSLKYSF